MRELMRALRRRFRRYRDPVDIVDLVHVRILGVIPRVYDYEEEERHAMDR